jgi:hypothetical protein
MKKSIVTARSKARNVFARSKAGVVGFESKPRHECLCVFVLFYVQVEALRRAGLPSKVSYRLSIGLRMLKSGQGPTKGCRAIDR